jgi:RNA polymerase sigma-70 factor (ECF subfamily)
MSLMGAHNRVNSTGLEQQWRGRAHADLMRIFAADQFTRLALRRERDALLRRSPACVPPYPMPTDQELLGTIARWLDSAGSDSNGSDGVSAGLGESEALAHGAMSALYDRYAKLVYGFVLGILKDTDAAEDVAQEVFVQVWRKAETYKPELGAPKQWIVRIAHNRAINVLRSKRSREMQQETPIPSDLEANPAMSAQLSGNSTWETTTNAEESQLIQRALGVLPAEQRELIELAFFQGYSHSEIAEMTAIPLGTVKTRIRSGIHSLRGQLKYLNETA